MRRVRQSWTLGRASTRTRASALAAVTLAALTSMRCQSPTLLRVASLSEVDCAKGARVALVVAHDFAGLSGAAPSAFSTMCVASSSNGLNDTGAVVLTPATSKDEPLAFALMTRPDGESPESCTVPGEASHCIIAHRQLRFSPHDALDVPVELRLSCLGVVCPPQQTCRKGQCTDATLPANCGACSEAALGPTSAPVCGSVDGLQAGAPWPMAAFCPTRAGRSGRFGPRTPAVRWKFQTGGIASMAPAVSADGTIYIGANDHLVYAVDPQGRERWRAPVASNINDSGFVIGADGSLYVGCSDTNVYAFTPGGQQKWATSVQADVGLAPVAGGDGTLYVGGLDIVGPAPLFALAADGTTKWQLAPRFGTSAVAIGADGTLYVGGVDSMLYALRPGDGSTVWSAKTNTPPASPSVGADGTIYVPDAENLYAFDPTGARKWAVPIDSRAAGVALAPDDTVYAAAQSGTLYAVLASGRVKWTYAPGTTWTRAPIVGGDGTVYVGGSDGALYAVSVAGALLWKVQTGGGINSEPAIGADGTLYFVSTDSNLYAIGP
jgi:outer membrane protein assembly factor BamB